MKLRLRNTPANQLGRQSKNSTKRIIKKPLDESGFLIDDPLGASFGFGLKVLKELQNEY